MTWLPSRLAVVVALSLAVHPDWHTHAHKHVYLPLVVASRLTFSIFSALIMYGGICFCFRWSGLGLCWNFIFIFLFILLNFVTWLSSHLQAADVPH
jgi:hypothetical protein